MEQKSTAARSRSTKLDRKLILAAADAVVHAAAAVEAAAAVAADAGSCGQIFKRRRKLTLRPENSCSFGQKRA
jgi:hexokinase